VVGTIGLENTEFISLKRIEFLCLASRFGSNYEFIHGIQFLPFTPITEVYLDVTFMKVLGCYMCKVSVFYLLLFLFRRHFKEETAFLNKGGAITTDFFCYILQAKAIVDQDNQWNSATKLNAAQIHRGSSRTNIYWWIATRNNTTFYN
jgi:hypothetical protein